MTVLVLNWVIFLGRKNKYILILIWYHVKMKSGNERKQIQMFNRFKISDLTTYCSKENIVEYILLIFLYFIKTFNWNIITSLSSFHDLLPTLLISPHLQNSLYYYASQIHGLFFIILVTHIHMHNYINIIRRVRLVWPMCIWFQDEPLCLEKSIRGSSWERLMLPLSAVSCL